VGKNCRSGSDRKPDKTIYIKKDIGRIKDIEVISRGESGKIRSVKITGSNGSSVINLELNLRKYLAKPPLYSGNFYIIKNGY
jgi:hypothetical protein